MIPSRVEVPRSNVLYLPPPLAIPCALAESALRLRELGRREVEAGALSQVSGEAIGVYDYGRGMRPLSGLLSFTYRPVAGRRRRRTVAVDECDVDRLGALLSRGLGHPVAIPAAPVESLWVEAEDRRSFMLLRRDEPRRRLGALDLQIRALAELCCGRIGGPPMRARASVRLILDVVLYLEEDLTLRQESDLYIQARCSFVAADAAPNDEPRRGHHVTTFRTLPDFEGLRRVVEAAQTAYESFSPVDA
ncbi:MAG: hypothetical protein R3B09_27520 [Nannocystaceae bacterium]